MEILSAHINEAQKVISVLVLSSGRGAHLGGLGHGIIISSEIHF